VHATILFHHPATTCVCSKLSPRTCAVGKPSRPPSGVLSSRPPRADSLGLQRSYLRGRGGRFNFTGSTPDVLYVHNFTADSRKVTHTSNRTAVYDSVRSMHLSANTNPHLKVFFNVGGALGGAERRNCEQGEHRDGWMQGRETDSRREVVYEIADRNGRTRKTLADFSVIVSRKNSQGAFQKKARHRCSSSQTPITAPAAAPGRAVPRRRPKPLVQSVPPRSLGRPHWRRHRRDRLRPHHAVRWQAQCAPELPACWLRS
jgi:hypothetical protein